MKTPCNFHYVSKLASEMLTCLHRTAAGGSVEPLTAFFTSSVSDTSFHFSSLSELV